MDEDSYWEFEEVKRLAMFSIPSDIWLAVIILLTEFGRIFSFLWWVSLVLFAFNSIAGFFAWIVTRNRIK